MPLVGAALRFWGPQKVLCPSLGTEPNPVSGGSYGPARFRRPEKRPRGHTDTKNERCGDQSRANHNTAYRALWGHKSPHLGLGTGPNPASGGSHGPVGPQMPGKCLGYHAAVTFPNRSKCPPYAGNEQAKGQGVNSKIAVTTFCPFPNPAGRAGKRAGNLLPRPTPLFLPVEVNRKILHILYSRYPTTLFRVRLTVSLSIRSETTRSNPFACARFPQ